MRRPSAPGRQREAFRHRRRACRRRLWPLGRRRRRHRRRLGGERRLQRRHPLRSGCRWAATAARPAMAARRGDELRPRADLRRQRLRPCGAVGRRRRRPRRRFGRLERLGAQLRCQPRRRRRRDRRRRRSQHRPRSGTVSTTGKHSIGIFAQSVGGGGGLVRTMSTRPAGRSERLDHRRCPDAARQLPRLRPVRRHRRQRRRRRGDRRPHRRTGRHDGRNAHGVVGRASAAAAARSAAA